MNRSRSLFLLLSLALLVPLVTGVLWSAADRRSEEGADSFYKHLAIFSEVLGLVRNNYVDPTDLDRLLSGAMDGSTDALDAFSVYLPADGVARYTRALALGTSLSGLTAVRDRGIAFVVAVEEGSPGAAAGFESGDILAKIGDRSTRDMPAWEMETALAGDGVDKLACEVIRRGDAKILELAPAPFAPPAPRLSETAGLPLLRIARFDAGSAAATRPLLAGLAEKGATRLLVDLRELAGGSAAAAYDVAALFAQGELGRLAERGRAVKSFAGAAAPVWQGQIAVLVDSGTLGAAEILAVALRDRAGAKLIGVKTFGWAGERTLLALAGGGRLHLTTSFYAGPDGKPLSAGIAPDLLVDELSRTFGERDKSLRDLILDRGVRYLNGEPEAAGERAA